MVSTKIHFKEINFVIYFPATGNEGREYGKYGVAYRDRDTGETQPDVRINLEEVLSIPKIKENYPHNLGLYIESRGRGNNYKPEYLESVIINDEKELIEFLKTNEL